MRATLLSLVAAVALSAASSDARSGFTVMYTGVFTGDADVQLIEFRLGAEHDVILQTFSYAGGPKADGPVVARGGFDPILALFDGNGILIGQNDDGGYRVPGDAVTGAHGDAYFHTVLEPGAYTVSLMQYGNFARGPFLANGFQGPNTTRFRDNAGDLRDGHWAVGIRLELNPDVVSAPSIPVPEGDTWVLMAIGLIAIVLLRYRAGKRLIRQGL